MTARSRSKSTGSFSFVAAIVFAIVLGMVSIAPVAGQSQTQDKPSKSDKGAKAKGEAKAQPQPPAPVATNTQAPAATAAPAAVVPPVSAPNVNGAPAMTAAPGVSVAPDYVIGSDDVLSVVFWRDKELTADVTVRPDGNISIPLINDVHAAGLTPAQLKDRIAEESRKYIEDPSVTVVVKEIKSRRVYVTGEVRKPGPYSLTTQMTVLQLISVAGGLADYAKPEKISIVRNEGGKPVSYKFNYKEVLDGKKLAQNIELKPGDTIIVP